MALSLLKKIFRGSGADSAKPGKTVEFEGYIIRPVPKKQGGQFLTAGVISKSFPDGIREHRFIRADTHAGFDSACDHAILKARQIIREQGDRIFQNQATRGCALHS